MTTDKDSPPVPAPQRVLKKRGAKPTAGRFATREELVEAVWRDYLHSPRKQAEIARACRVSTGVVASILAEPRPASVPPHPDDPQA